MSAFSISFNLPFDEAIKQAKSRGVMLPEAYYAQPAEYRRITQSISGMANLDQIQNVINSLNKHVAEGGTLHSFQEAVDEMNVGLTRGHLDLIFRNGVQNAYNAGHWRNFEQFKDTRPYLRYDAVNDSRTRPSHRVLDNVIKPVDDPFWYTHSPPLGHRCRCRLLSLSAAQAKDRGGVTANPDPPGIPDKGFGGKPTQLGEQMDWLEKKKLERASPVLQEAYNARMNTPELNKLDGDAIAYVVGNGRRTGFEYLYVYDSVTGKALATHTNNLPDGVAMPESIKAAALDRERKLVVHHNHPDSSPPSAADIKSISEYAGISTAVIDGHDGSIYRVSALERGNVLKSIAAISPAWRSFEIETIGKLSPDDKNFVISVARLKAMDMAGVIKLEATDVPDNLKSFVENLTKRFYDAIMQKIIKR